MSRQPDSAPAELQGLAARVGIHTGYRDAYGQQHETSTETLLALLNALGLDIDHADQAAAWNRELHEHAGPTTYAALDGRLPALPAGTIVLEGGEELTDPERPLPAGIHQLHGSQAQHWIIAAPTACWHPPVQPRLGLFAPTYALHDAGRGMGDLSLLGRLGAWAGAHGCDFIGTLPLLATFPGDHSPYSPVSRVMWNELYLAAEPLGLEPWIAATDARRVIDFEAARAVQRRQVEPLVAAAEDLERQAAGVPDVGDYAAFRAAMSRGQRPAPGQHLPVDPRDPEWRFHAWVQLQLRAQMSELRRTLSGAGVGLYLDLPVGANGGGFDVWRHHRQFLAGVSVGAPPDDFFSGGQNWGFPPLDPRASAASGHEHFRAVLHHHCEAASLLRIDHVMALHRLWCIPEGFDARDGAYLSYPTDSLFAALSLASHRWHTRIIGENLGTVPDAVTDAMRRHEVTGMRVMQFEISPERPLPEIEGNDLKCLNTHDMPRFAAWWQGRDIEQRVAMGLLEDAAAAGVHDRRHHIRRSVRHALGLPDDAAVDAVLASLLRWLAARPGPLLLDIDDLWGELHPHNLPGTVNDSNWSRPLALSMEAIEAADFTALLHELAEASR